MVMAKICNDYYNYNNNNSNSDTNADNYVDSEYDDSDLHGLYWFTKNGGVTFKGPCSRDYDWCPKHRCMKYKVRSEMGKYNICEDCDRNKLCPHNGSIAAIPLYDEPIIYRDSHGRLYWYCRACADWYRPTGSATKAHRSQIRYLESNKNPHSLNMKRIYKILDVVKATDEELQAIKQEDAKDRDKNIVPSIGETYQLLARDDSAQQGVFLLDVYRVLKHDKQNENKHWHPLSQEFRLMHAEWNDGLLLTKNQQVNYRIEKVIKDLMVRFGDDFVVTANVLGDVLDERPATVHARLEILVKDGLLTRHEGTHQTQYCLKGKSGRRTTLTYDQLDSVLDDVLGLDEF
jgi:hypothetical protein